MVCSDPNIDGASVASPWRFRHEQAVAGYPNGRLGGVRWFRLSMSAACAHYNRRHEAPSSSVHLSPLKLNASAPEFGPCGDEPPKDRVRFETSPSMPRT